MSDLPEQLPPKREVARALLVRGSVFVHLDPRAEGVRVPPWLADRAQLVLQVGLDMPVPIPDLRIDDAGVYATLSFSRHPYRCEVPWPAVFALVGDDGRGMVWPEELPDELAAEVEREARRRSRFPPDGEATAGASGPPGRPTIPPPPPTAAPLDALRGAQGPARPPAVPFRKDASGSGGDRVRPTPVERPGASAPPSGPPGLRVVPGGADSAQPSSSRSSPPPRRSGRPGTSQRPLPPYLRVVK